MSPPRPGSSRTYWPGCCRGRSLAAHRTGRPHELRGPRHSRGRPEAGPQRRPQAQLLAVLIGMATNLGLTRDGRGLRHPLRRAALDPGMVRAGGNAAGGQHGHRHRPPDPRARDRHPRRGPDQLRVVDLVGKGLSPRIPDLANITMAREVTLTGIGSCTRTPGLGVPPGGRGPGRRHAVSTCCAWPGH